MPDTATKSEIQGGYGGEPAAFAERHQVLRAEGSSDRRATSAAGQPIAPLHPTRRGSSTSKV
jgi:hypothetical protein